MFKGAYVFYPCEATRQRLNLPDCKIRIPNLVVAEGKEQFLRAVTRNEGMGLTGGPPPLFYIGLCDQVPAVTDTLTSITTEPTSAGGYARIGIERSSVGWPTIDEVNGVKRAASQIVTFAASGADFSSSFSRAFLCSVASGTLGFLFSYSGPLSVPIALLDGESIDVQYELYFN